MSSDAPMQTRQQYDALQAQLSTRKSTLHFAHAAVSTVLTIILAGTSGRLFWKAEPDDLPIAWAAGILAAVTICYALTRFGIGFSRLKVELKDFAKLQALHQKLGLDDPARLIPR